MGKKKSTQSTPGELVEQDARPVQRLPPEQERMCWGGIGKGLASYSTHPSGETLGLS